MITGETGTGKELLARAIHDLWVAAGPTRQGRELETLFVAGMSKDQVNDELFGHVRGAFTDAKSDRKGRLELADGTTLLIDEVGDLSPEAQVRLLRFLDRGEVARLGANDTTRVKVRIVAATLKNLEEEVERGHFRRDLLYRLHGVQSSCRRSGIVPIPSTISYLRYWTGSSPRLRRKGARERTGSSERGEGRPEALGGPVQTRRESMVDGFCTICVSMHE